MGTLTKHTKISCIWKFRKNKETKERKHLKTWDDHIKQLIESKKSSYKTLENKIDYKGNTTLAKREVRRRHRASWDKFGTNLSMSHIGVNLNYTKV